MPVMDFVHDDTGSHRVVAGRKAAVALAEDDELDLFTDVADPPDPPEEENEPEPVEPDDGEDEGGPEVEPAIEEPEEDEPAPTARARRTRQADEIARLVREAREAQARAEEAERRYYAEARKNAETELVAIKNHALNLTHQFEQAKREYAEAVELGETAKVPDIHARLNDLQFEMRRAQDFTRVREQELLKPGLTAPPPPPRPAPPPNPRAEAWAKRNKWFGDTTKQRHAGLTAAAYAFDAMLINEGQNPYTDAFYDELDRRLRAFAAPSAQRRQTVAGVPNRTSAGVRRPGRAVRLTPEMKVMAARLNVPESEYAKYVEI